MVNSFLHRTSFSLFPGRCLLCLGATHTAEDICHDCRDELPWLTQPCARCALPLANASDETPAFCGNCLRSSPRFDQCLAAWEYAYPVDQLISRFKYQGQRLAGELLARLSLERFVSASPPDLLLAVPMHWRRYWRRGFNQADIIALHWSKALDIPMLAGVHRQSYQPPQRGLSATQRQRNLSAAFRATENVDLRHKHVVIVDDVVTTGATANSLAAILRMAGAERVSVWCLARTA